VQLDAGRLQDLSVFTAAELRPICLGVIGAIAEQLEALDRALAAGQLESAAEAAHSARNEALLVGARELSDAFAALESASRAGHSSGAAKAAELAREVWPETRVAIDALADHGATG
jgi:HPt (histidine-containing phosphotransfer) domain-containing protein